MLEVKKVMNVINLVLVKKDMLRYVQDVKAVRRRLSDHIVQFKVSLVGA